MLDHEKVFEVAKNDTEFLADLAATNQRIPSWFVGTLEQGIWAAGYAGWVLGKHGIEAYKALYMRVLVSPSYDEG